jgi:hypothetical protein
MLLQVHPKYVSSPHPYHSSSYQSQPLPHSPRHEDIPSEPSLALNVHGGIDTSCRMHHRFKRQEVPYPRSYQRKVVDLYVPISFFDIDSSLSRDAIDTLLTRQMTGGSLTWHSFPQSWNEPPQQGPLKRILDIGCGNGVWVIEAAKHWKGCEVVGKSCPRHLREALILCRPRYCISPS